MAMTTTETHQTTCAATACDLPRWGKKDYCRKHQERLNRNGTLEPKKTGPKTGVTTAECARCRQSFKATPRQRERSAEGRDVFCSRDCQKGANLIDLECASCGMPVVRRKSDVKGSRVFCSADCRNEAGSKTRTGRHITCEGPGCETPVWVIPTLEGKKRYCSPRCSNRGQERRQDRTCGSCQGTFTVPMSSDAAYCSRDCFHEARRAKPGDRYVTPATGYAWVWVDDGAGNVVKVLEHRHVMEGVVGRPLRPEETVHHLTGGFKGRSNNHPDNLELWTGRHPKGHRVEDVTAYAREMLALYGDPDERARYAAVAPA